MKETKERKEPAISERYSPGWRRDYAFTKAFRLPYIQQVLTLLMITGIFLFMRAVFCPAGYKPLFLAAGGICIVIYAWQAEKAKRIICQIKKLDIRMKDVSHWKAEQDETLFWMEGWSCYYAEYSENIICVLPKSVLNTEQKEKWTERHGWPGKKKTAGLVLAFGMFALAAVTLSALLQEISVFLAGISM